MNSHIIFHLVNVEDDSGEKGNKYRCAHSRGKFQKENVETSNVRNASIGKVEGRRRSDEGKGGGVRREK